jgi:hypothetical protein
MTEKGYREMDAWERVIYDIDSSTWNANIEPVDALTVVRQLAVACQGLGAQVRELREVVRQLREQVGGQTIR